MQYSFKKTLVKVVWFLIAVGPIVLNWLPAEWQNITLGAVFIAAMNALKFWYQKNFI